MLFPTTAICEAVTVLRGKLNRPEDASRIVQKFQSGDFPIQAVDHQILTDAAALFHPLASKKNTLFDAVVAALAKKLHADAIFSFDGWYGKIGLSLASDLLEQSKEAAYMLPARNCGVSLGIRQPGMRLQRFLAGVIPQIRCGSI